MPGEVVGAACGVGAGQRGGRAGEHGAGGVVGPGRGAYAAEAVLVEEFDPALAERGAVLGRALRDRQRPYWSALRGVRGRLGYPAPQLSDRHRLSVQGGDNRVGRGGPAVGDGPYDDLRRGRWGATGTAAGAQGVRARAVARLQVRFGRLLGEPSGRGDGLRVRAGRRVALGGGADGRAEGVGEREQYVRAGELAFGGGIRVRGRRRAGERTDLDGSVRSDPGQFDGGAHRAAGAVRGDTRPEDDSPVGSGAVQDGGRLGGSLRWWRRLRDHDRQRRHVRGRVRIRCRRGPDGAVVFGVGPGGGHLGRGGALSVGARSDVVVGRVRDVRGRGEGRRRGRVRRRDGPRRRRRGVG